MESQMLFTLVISKLIKTVNPCIKIGVGGPQISLAYEEIKNIAVFDFVVRGEAETELLAIINKLESKRSNSRTKQFTKVKFNFDKTPFLDYSLFDLSIYDKPLGLPIEFSRGCTSNCIYCTHNKLCTFKIKSPKRMVAEIEYLYEKTKVRNFFFCDNLINSIPTKLEELCDLLIQKNFDINWCADARLERLDLQLLMKMKKAGCSVLFFGLESASPRVLRLMNKRINLRKAAEIIKNSKKAGIWVHLFIIAGFPGESSNDLKLTIDFIKKHKKYINSAHVQPFRLQLGSYMFNNPAKYGIKIEEPYEKSELIFELSQLFTTTIDSAISLNNKIRKATANSKTSSEIAGICSEDSIIPKEFIISYLEKMKKIPSSVFFIYNYSTEDSNFYQSFLKYRQVLYEISQAGLRFYPEAKDVFK